MKHHLKSGSMRSNVPKIRVYTLIMLSHNLYVDPLKAKQRKCCYLWVLHHQCKILLRPVVCYGLRPATDGMQSAIIFGSVLLKNVDFK